MKKKEVLVGLGFLIVLISSVFASAVSDVAYIYRKDFKIDENVVDVITDGGLTIDFISEASLPRDLEDYKFIFVGDENFRKKQLIPVNDVPSVVANYYHSGYWGFTDGEGVSQLASSHPLSVVKGGFMIPVYTVASEGLGGSSISYYYLDEENKAPAMETVALTETTSSGDDFGDVISYASPGDVLFNGRVQSSKLCYFGIIESDYWTPQARSLFEDCVGYVASECDSDSDCPSSSLIGDEYCFDGNVYQNEKIYTCENGGLTSECVADTGSVLVEECYYGCLEGECLEVDCFADSDCGLDQYVGEDYCSGGDVYRKLQVFECSDAGTVDSECSDYVESVLIEECGSLCVAGECFQPDCDFDSDCDDFDPLTFDECLHPGTVSSECRNTPINCAVDSDCGFIGFYGDEYCSGDDVMKKKMTQNCIDAGTVESHCAGNVTSEVVIYECDFACFDGDCIDCDSDADCDDSNPLTFDECLFAGTLESRCTHGAIQCFEDLDCGVDGLIDEPYCSDDGLDVVQLYRTWECVDAGTTSSTCAFEVSPELIDECSDFCLQGECVDVECVHDSDCDDFDPLTFDECLFAGTSYSECRNTPMDCLTDSDCGVPGLFGEEYCSGDNVARDYQTPFCVDAGTVDSNCDFGISMQVIEECDFACFDGDCIRCDENSDCDDLDSLTADICVSPGTVDSECIYEDITPEIVCSSDAECGDPILLSGLFCSFNDVSQLVMNWECENAGTGTSYCASSLSLDILEDCLEYCSEGACVSIECFHNSDCDDGDDLTADECLNPGTVSSECVHTPVSVICAEDSDCGVDGIIMDGICVGQEITQLYQEFDCVNAGTASSYCSSNVIQEVVETCNFVCSGGVCIGEPGECSAGEVETCGSSDVGECSFGERVCDSSGSWGSCVGSVEPVVEICDGLDNDCDGSVDEGGVCGPSCVDECVAFSRECLDLDHYRVCADFDGDGCSEWSLPGDCGFGLECSGGDCVSI